MPSSTWKAVELAVAKKLGGQRIPVTGERAAADVIVDDALGAVLFVQVKHRKRGIARDVKRVTHDISTKALEARGVAALAPTGIAVWHTPGDNLGDSIVTMRFADFVDLWGA